MYEWVRKIHMYAGLLSFVAFFVWGVAGIHAVFLPPGDYQHPEPSDERLVPFEAPGDVDDRQLARVIFDSIDIPMSLWHYEVHRNDAGLLTFFVSTPNGRRDVTYLEEQRQVRIEIRQAGLAYFLSAMHTGHSRRGSPELSSRLWGYYNEFSTWAFLFMALSGIYMWIATRPRLLWAQIVMGGSLVVFLILWATTR